MKKDRLNKGRGGGPEEGKEKKESEGDSEEKLKLGGELLIKKSERS